MLLESWMPKRKWDQLAFPFVNCHCHSNCHLGCKCREPLDEQNALLALKKWTEAHTAQSNWNCLGCWWFWHNMGSGEICSTQHSGMLVQHVHPYQHIESFWQQSLCCHGPTCGRNKLRKEKLQKPNPVDKGWFCVVVDQWSKDKSGVTMRANFSTTLP